MKLKTILAAGFATAMFAAPALAQDACLRLNDVRSMNPHDDTTLVVTDRQNNEYTVTTTAHCAGFQTPGRNLTFRPQSELSCIRPGDTIGYTLPGEAPDYRVHGNLQSTCSVASVTAGAPG